MLLTSLHDLWLVCTATSTLWTTAINAKIVTAGSGSDPVLSSLLLYINKKTVSGAGFGRRR